MGRSRRNGRSDESGGARRNGVGIKCTVTEIDIAGLLTTTPDDEDDLFVKLRAAESIGRPLGSDRFLARIEKLTGRVLKPGKRGPKPAEWEAR